MNRRHFLSQIGLATATVTAYPLVKFTAFPAPHVNTDPSQRLMRAYNLLAEIHGAPPTAFYVSAQFLEDYFTSMRHFNPIVDLTALGGTTLWFKHCIMQAHPDLQGNDVVPLVWDPRGRSLPSDPQVCQHWRDKLDRL